MVPPRYVRVLLDLLARWDVTELDEPKMQIPAHVFAELVEIARQRTGEDGLAVFLGQQYQLSLIDSLADAQTLRDLFGQLDVAAHRTATTTIGDEISISLIETESVGTLREVTLIASFVCLVGLANAVTGQPIAARADATFAEPKWFRRLAHLIPGQINFAQPKQQLFVAAAALDLPILDRPQIAKARMACDHALDARSEESRRIHRVRRLLPREHTVGYRSLEEVAHEMATSTRTLERALAASNTSFTALLDGERRDRGLRMLRETNLSVEKIAQQLGYATVAGFARALRRWTQLTPGQYRRESRVSSRS